MNNLEMEDKLFKFLEKERKAMWDRFHDQADQMAKEISEQENIEGQPMAGLKAGNQKEQKVEEIYNLIDEQDKDVQVGAFSVCPGYESLADILQDALDQSQKGKGKKRHARGEPFRDQQICQGARKHGLGAMSYQVEKKINEAKRLFEEYADFGEAEKDILGAVVYAAAMLLVMREQADSQPEFNKDKQQAEAA